MKRVTIAEIVSLFFICLFLYTGIEKVTDYPSFKEQVYVSGILSSIITKIAWIIPAIEIATSVLLFIPKTRLTGLYATLFLMITFTLYLTSTLKYGILMSCGCGGIIEALSPGQHLVFNGACLLLNIVGISETRNNRRMHRIRKIAPFVTVVLLVLAAGTIFLASLSQDKRKTGLEGTSLPSFRLLLADSITELNTADIPAGKRIIIIGFSPICQHCRAEVSSIIRHLNNFKDTQFYLVTSFPYSAMKRFYGQYQLGRYSNITTGIDKKNVFLSFYKSTYVPFTVIYDNKKILKEAIQGEVGFKDLTRIASE